MRTIRLYIIISISILFFSCGDDDKENTELPSLKQTSWKGSLVVGENPESSVGIAFYTETSGYYDLKYSEGDLYQDNFEYTANGKLLEIKGNTMISGSWLLIRKSNNTIILVQGTDANLSTKRTMALERGN